MPFLGFTDTIISGKYHISQIGSLLSKWKLHTWIKHQ